MSDETEPPGLPPMSPDEAEQDLADEADNVVPTYAYQRLPMVGLGGSAGSINALQAFFRAMPNDSGMVFVVIIHLSPEHESTLAELLQRCTTMPVIQVKATEKVQPNQVYVIPPGKALKSLDGSLRLSELELEPGRRVAVDLFFRTLADTHGPHAAAIVLSGADGDGSVGIKRIKERGGLTIAQDPTEAEQPSMPRAAIRTTMIDWILPVSEMPARLMRYVEQERRMDLPPEDGPQPAKPTIPAVNASEAALRDVLTFLRVRTQRDFSYYKRATIVRRVSRRMQVNGLDDLPSYLNFLRMHPGEAGALLQDLLISVTNFFRDREAFAALEAQIPQLFANKGPADTVRVWVPACATGEEAYSIGILLSEHAKTLELPPQIQIFATDLDEEVIRAARDGHYSPAITADVSEERLRAFFTLDQRGYRIRRELREMVLFSLHDLLKDSPFSRLDLVSCRNLLIYLDREAQLLALDIFNFALRGEGRLFLGVSESIDEDSPLFAVLDKKHRLFVRRNMQRRMLPVPVGPGALALALDAQQRLKPAPIIVPTSQARDVSIAALEHRLKSTPPPLSSWGELHLRLIEQLGPPSLVVNSDFDILHMSGPAARFLQFNRGEPTTNLLKLVHPLLRIELRAALYRAAQARQPAEAADLLVEIDGEQMIVNIRVVPDDSLGSPTLLVVFEPQSTGKPAAARQTPVQPGKAAQQLERALEQTQIHLRDTVEQFEASTEELKASNEELQAMNEELRSATEELETSREELQSINEELTTVNQELRGKVGQLDDANSDLQNLMAATAIATVFLDRDLRITFYTPPTKAIFNLIASDIGRPLTDLTHRLDYQNLAADAAQVLEHLAPIEREVGQQGQKWFLVRLLPYRTTEDRIGGVVLTFVDITAGKQAESLLRTNEERFRSFFDNAAVGMAQADLLSGKMLTVNQALCQITGYTEDELRGRSIADLTHADDRDANWGTVQTNAGSAPPNYQAEKRLIRKNDEVIWARINTAVTRDSQNRPASIALVLENISEAKAAERSLYLSVEELERRVQERTQDLRNANAQLKAEMHERQKSERGRTQLLQRLTKAQEDERQRVARELHDQMGQLVAALNIQLRNLENDVQQAPELLKRLQQSQQLVGQIGREIHDLALELRPTALDDLGLQAALAHYVETWSTRSGISADFHTNCLDVHRLPSATESTLYRVAQEALTNVAKHSQATRASVVLECRDDRVVAIIEDDGIGFDVAHVTQTSQRLGLLGIRERLMLLNGELEIESAEGRGTTVFAKLPMTEELPPMLDEQP